MAPAIFEPDQGAELQEIAAGGRLKMEYLTSDVFFDEAAGSDINHQALQTEIGVIRAVGYMKSGNFLPKEVCLVASRAIVFHSILFSG